MKVLGEFQQQCMKEFRSLAKFYVLEIQLSKMHSYKICKVSQKNLLATKPEKHCAAIDLKSGTVVHRNMLNCYRFGWC